MLIDISKTAKKPLKLKIPLSTTITILIIKFFIYKKLRENGIKLSRKQKRAISKAIRYNKKILKGYKIVEVSSADGEKVDIYL